MKKKRIRGKEKNKIKKRRKTGEHKERKKKGREETEEKEIRKKRKQRMIGKGKKKNHRLAKPPFPVHNLLGEKKNQQLQLRQGPMPS
jgi:hypothetical protein